MGYDAERNPKGEYSLPDSNEPLTVGPRCTLARVAPSYLFRVSIAAIL